jgi:hypothetical protein
MRGAITISLETTGTWADYRFAPLVVNQGGEIVRVNVQAEKQFV